MSSQMSAVELLNLGDDCRQKPLLNNIWPTVLGLWMGGLNGAFLNFTTKRPIFSGVQKYAVAIAAWTVGLNFLETRRLAYYAERDAVLRHYVELHPEDFKEPPKKRIGEIIEPWIPIR